MAVNQERSFGHWTMHGIHIIEVPQHFSVTWGDSISGLLQIVPQFQYENGGVLHLKVDPRAARGLFRNGEAYS
jgi:hypothetical protein